MKGEMAAKLGELIEILPERLTYDFNLAELGSMVFALQMCC